MAKYKFKNILGEFYFDEHFRIVKKPKSDKGIEEPEGRALLNILGSFKEHKYYQEFRLKNMQITRKKIRESLSNDNLVVQASHHIDELGRIINSLAKRLREWYELYNPEFSRSVQNHEKFAELIVKKSKKELLKEIKVKESESMGGKLPEKDLKPILDLARQIKGISDFKKSQEKYLESLMRSYCPNMVAITGGLIGAKLLSIAGSLKRLVEFPASTIQLLGAEKALFRHMRTGAKSPKFGVIHSHPIVQKAAKKDKGKAARTLADKISIAVKVDYFKGEFIGDKLRKQVEVKFQ